MKHIQHRLVFDSPEGINVRTTDSDNFPVRLEHKGVAYFPENMMAVVHTSVELTAEEAVDIAHRLIQAVGEIPERIDTPHTVRLELDRDYLARLAGMFDLEIVDLDKDQADLENKRSRVYIDTKHFHELAHMVGFGVKERTA